MKYTIAVALVLCVVSGQTLAGKRTITGNNGPVSVGQPYTGVVNKGTINGGTGTGLTVTGSAARSVVNKGTITGRTGLSVSGSSSSSVTNHGTISGVSTGGSSAKATGVSVSN